MGSITEVVRTVVEKLNNEGKKVGMLSVRLYRPCSIKAFIKALPKSCVAIAVLVRCKEPNSMAEPLYMDVVNALNEAQENHHAHDWVISALALGAKNRKK